MAVRVGDVFTIPVDEKRVGIGQILFRNKGPGPLYIAVFETLFEKGDFLPPEDISDLKVVLIGSSMDALIEIDYWKVIGNLRVDLSRVVLPLFKTGRENDFYIENFFGERLRKATVEEVEFFDYPFSVAPIRFEKALKAYHGLLPWSSSYDKLSVRYGFEHGQ